MYGSLDISTSGMIAQRIRFEVSASNIANKDALRDAQNNLNPYQRRAVMLAPGDPSATSEQGRAMGVHVADISLDQNRNLVRRYDPSDPNSYKSGPMAGYIADTNVNLIVENVNAIEAMRAYEANVMTAEATKQMLGMALRLVA